MQRGRPIKSSIRNNIIEILYFLKKAHGYEIYKIYKEIFGKVAQKSIYYNLNKGISTKEFELKQVKKQLGNYSWGSTSEINIFTLGAHANPQINKQVKDYFDKR